MKAELTTYWPEVCAPALKARKDELGRKVPEREIAAYVESETGQDSSRQLVSLWLLGKREPTITQFIALCNKLGVEPEEVLRIKSRTLKREPLFRSGRGEVNNAKRRSG